MGGVFSRQLDAEFHVAGSRHRPCPRDQGDTTYKPLACRSEATPWYTSSAAGRTLRRSNHPGGVNVVMADGSVHSSRNINLAVARRATMAAAKPMALDGK